jgi:hypothetical protein
MNEPTATEEALELANRILTAPNRQSALKLYYSHLSKFNGVMAKPASGGDSLPFGEIVGRQINEKFPMNDGPCRYVLHTGRFQIEMFLDEETGEMRCDWSPHPPRTTAQMRHVLKQYTPWRNDIISGWSQRTGKSIMLVNGLPPHVESVTMIDGEKIETKPL